MIFSDEKQRELLFWLSSQQNYNNQQNIFEMKKVIFICTMMLLMAVHAFNAYAQGESKEYFIGKWQVSVPGLPMGDVDMIVDINRVDGNLKGTISALEQTVEIERITEREKSITLYFVGEGYDVDLTLTKKNQNEVTGDMLGQFDATGKRIKADKANKSKKK